MIATTLFTSHVAALKNELDPYLYDLALKFKGIVEHDGPLIVEHDGPLDVPDTPEFEAVLHEVVKADHLDFNQALDLDRKLKADKYTLYETYMKLIDEILSDSHLEPMSKRYNQKFESVAEMRQLGEEEAKELSL